MSKIIPGEKYRDRSGNLYQVICKALSLESERNVIIVQQLFGDYLRLSVPQDKFDGIFTDVDVMVTRPPEREKAISTKGQSSVRRLEEEVEKAVAEPSDAESAESPQMQDMLTFLDTDDFEEKFKIAKKMAEQSEIDDTILDNMAASLDFIIDDGPLDKRIDELLHCLGTRKRFETTRLRDN